MKVESNLRFHSVPFTTRRGKYPDGQSWTARWFESPSPENPDSWECFLNGEPVGKVRLGALLTHVSAPPVPAEAYGFGYEPPPGTVASLRGTRS